MKNLAAILVFIITLAPAILACALIGPASPQHLPTLTPTIQPTPTADPLASEREAYLSKVRENVANIKVGLDELIKTSEDTEITGEELFNRIVISLGFIRAGHENLAELTYPQGLRNYHILLIQTTTHCHEGATLLAEGADSSDKEKTRIGAELLISCRAEIEKISSELEN